MIGRPSAKETLAGRYAAVLLVASLVGWPALSAIPALLDLDSRALSVPFRAALLSLALVVLWVRTRPRPAAVAAPMFLFWLFWALYIARLAVDAAMNPAAMRLSAAEYFAYALGTGLIPSLALALSIEQPRLRRALLWTIVLGAIGCLGVTWLAAAGLRAGVAELVRTRSEIDAMDTISIGHLGVTVALLSAFVLVRADMFSLPLRLLMLAPLALGALNVALGSSKGPAIALLVCVPLLFHLSFTRSYNRITARAVLFAALVFTAGVLLARNAGSLVVIGRFAAALSGSDEGSVDVRIAFARDAWDMFLAHPILGAGTEPLGFYPHNVVLEAFMAVGVVGGLAFLALMLLSVTAALLLIWRRSPSAWLGLLLIQYTIGDLASSSLYMSASTWALRLLVIAQYAAEAPLLSSAFRYRAATARLLPSSG